MFTEEEKKLLEKFVTNLEGDVFVLRNLPEVVKGALFSRYSRSPKGLRQLLLDEFLKEDAAGMADSNSEEGGEDLLKIQKAQKFYDRMLDGYGDDSVGELGGVHLAFENVTNIATKVLEDMRIGGSPLEKSSRYVWFNKKVNEEYQFYKDPGIMASEFKDLYLETCNMLFELYDRLIEPMKKFYMERIPQEVGVPDRAYEFSIRAKACDSLRGLLPAGTLTNLGIFGNGRFFETMLLKLKAHPLQEMRDLGEKAQVELDKVIPSFVRRSKEGSKHFGAMEGFIKNFHEQSWKAGKEFVTGEVKPVKDEIVLVDYDKEADVKVLATYLYQHSIHPLEQVIEQVKAMPLEKRKEVLRKLLAQRENRRHKPPRAFENAYFLFDVLADFGIYRDLHRHRILTQERQDVCALHGYDLPQDIIDAGFGEEWKNVMEKAKEAWKKIHEKFPRESQYVVPLAYKIRWYLTMNPRSIYWMAELRSGPQGHPNYRRVAQKMYKLAKAASPLLFEYAKVDMNDYSLGRLQAEKKIAEKKGGGA